MRKYSNFEKYFHVGIISTIICLFLYYIFNNIGINYIISMAIGCIISSISGYFLSIHKYGKPNILSIKKYCTLFGIILVLNLLLIFYQVDYLGISSNIAPLFTIIITTALNYHISKRVLFNNKFKLSLRSIKEDINNNKLFYVILCITIIFVAIMFINNLFNYPASDDYVNYSKMLESGPKDGINGILSFIVALLNNIKTMQESYFSNILSCFNPLFISINMYKFTSLLAQLFWIYSLYFFFKSFFNKKNVRDIVLIYLVFLLFSIIFMYSISQGLYWINSINIYLVPYSMSLILFGFLIRYLKTNKNLWLYLSVIFSIILGGTNYTTGIFVGFILLFITLYLNFKKDGRKNNFIILTIIFSISFAFNILCLLNSDSINTIDELPISQFFLTSFINAYKMLKYLFFETIYIPLVIILMPTIKKLVRDAKFRFKRPIIITILCLGCFIILFMPDVFIYKNYYQEAGTTNIQLFYLVIMVTICFINHYGYMYQHKEFKDEITSPNLILIGFISSALMISSIGTSNISGFKLFDDIIYLKSKNYELCMKEMDSLIRNSKDKEVKISNCTEIPSSIHYHKLENDYKIIKALEKYYNKKIIVEE